MAAVLVEEPPAAATTASSIVTLINSSIGAGILALPYAFACTGWALGLAAVWGVAAVEGFTMYTISRYAEATGTSSYGALIRTQLGPCASLAMCLVVFLFLFGSCTAYLMILGDSFLPLLHAAAGGAWCPGRRAVIAAVGCTCVLPLTFKTSLGALRVGCILVVVGAIVARSAQIVGGAGHPWGAVRAANWDFGTWGALPLIVLGFACHTNVISVFTELEQHPALLFGEAAVAAPHPPEPQQGPAAQAPLARGGSGSWRRRAPKSRKLVGMVGVVAASVALTAALYSATGLMGYLAFPSNTQPDILLNFAADDWLMQVARGAVGLVLIASYPVVHFPARAAVRELLQHAGGGRRLGGAGFVAAEGLVFFGATLAVALLCTDLGAVFQLIGGTCGAALVLAAPGALLMQYSHAKHRQSRQQLGQDAERADEPLLAAAAAAAGGAGAPGAAPAGRSGRAAAAAEAGVPPLPAGAYHWWASKLFWAGASLQLLAAALAALTVATVARPPA